MTDDLSADAVITLDPARMGLDSGQCVFLWQLQARGQVDFALIDFGAGPTELRLTAR